MREIKFRAWDSSNNKMMADWGNVMLRVPHLTYMQYTGLNDKSFNEVEVYEGDLFGESGSEGIEVFGEVYFDADFAGFCVKYPSGGWTTLGEHLLEKQNHREVIGNIYENPELLEGVL